MYLAKSIQFCISLLVCLLVHSYNVKAKLTILLSNGTVATEPTNDPFLHPQSYDRLEGLAIRWGFLNRYQYKTCEIKPVDTSQLEVQDLLERAANYSNIAIIWDYTQYWGNGCTSVQNTTNAVVELRKQFAAAKFPPIKLIIMLDYLDYIVELWPEYVHYRVDNYFSEVIKSLSIPVSIIPSYNYVTPLTSLLLYGNFIDFHYIAEHELGSMNEKFISKGHLAYRWISIILIIAALIYAVARIVMLIRMKEYEYNLLTFSFVITIFYCFSLCYHLIHRVDLFRFQMPINNYIAIIIFNIILFHWSSVGIYLYSKRAIIAFRIVLLIVLVTNTISFVFICMYDVKEISDPVTDLVIRNRSFLILAAMSGVDSLIFAGFCMWFLYHIHKLRNHPNSYTRFTQLCLFTGLASATFIIYLVTTINWTQHGTDNNNETTATADTAFDVSGIVRAFIFIAALGVNWPSNTKRHSSVHEPLSGLTTIGNNNPTDSVVVNVPNQEKPNMRAPARVIVPIIEEV